MQLSSLSPRSPSPSPSNLSSSPPPDWDHHWAEAEGGRQGYLISLSCRWRLGIGICGAHCTAQITRTLSRCFSYRSYIPFILVYKYVYITSQINHPRCWLGTESHNYCGYLQCLLTGHFTSKVEFCTPSIPRVARSAYSTECDDSLNLRGQRHSHNLL